MNMSLKEKKNGIISLVPINASEIKIANINNKFITGKNVEGALEELKDNKTDILNTIGNEAMGTTATTVKGAIAEHGNQINNNTTQLNAIANERGYLNTKILGTTDWKTLTKNGRYKIENAINIDGSTENSFLIDVFSMNDSYVFQRAYCLYSTNSYNIGKTFVNYLDNGTWGGYKETVSTESKDLTLLNGWTKETGSLKAIKIGKKVFIDMEISGGTGSGTAICALPFHNVNDGQLWCVAVQNESWEMSNVNISIVNNQLLYWSDVNKRVPIHISYETI